MKLAMDCVNFLRTIVVTTRYESTEFVDFVLDLKIDGFAIWFRVLINSLHHTGKVFADAYPSELVLRNIVLMVSKVNVEYFLR